MNNYLSQEELQKLAMKLAKEIDEKAFAIGEEYQEQGLIKDPNYPHTCPKCKGPAYIGLNTIDCKKNC